MVKLIITDLDETLWAGTFLFENNRIKLKKNYLKRLLFFKEKGIPLTIISKNDKTKINSLLTTLKLSGLFIYPQINYLPKSYNLNEILKFFNISPEHAVFIDDDENERNEIKSSFPQINTFDPKDNWDLFIRNNYLPSNFDRIAFYKQQELRIKNNIINYDCDKFNHYSNFKIYIRKVKSIEVDRFYELLQRSNKLNFSGNKYSLNQIKSFSNSRNYKLFILEAKDKYGTFGICGGGIYFEQNSTLYINDLFLSCRIIGRGAELEVLKYFLYFSKRKNINNLELVYNPNSYNIMLKESIQQLNFIQKNEKSFVFNGIKSEILPQYSKSLKLTSEKMNFQQTGIPFLNYYLQKNLKLFDANQPILNFGSGWCETFDISIFKNYKLINVDICKETKPDIIADIEDLDCIKNESIRNAICLEVLEHIPNISKAISELHLKLAIDGIIFISIPFLIPYHRFSNDYWRFNNNDIEKIFNNFNIVNIHLEKYNNKILRYFIILGR